MRNQRVFLFPISLASLVCTGASARAEVLTVGGTNPDFLEIVDAVAVSADGDTILVHDGTYLHFAVDDKELSIVAVQPDVTVVGLVRVRNLSRSKHVLVSGLEFLGNGDEALQVYDNLGQVTLQECVVRGDPADLTACEYYAYLGAVIQNCDQVSLIDCSVYGGWGDLFWDDYGQCEGADGATALWVQDSNVAIHGGEYRGGYGSDIDENDEHGGTGGIGLAVGESSVWLSDVILVGGDGGYGGFPVISCGGGSGGSGGDALRVGFGASVRALGGSFTPGTGGEGWWEPCDTFCDYDCPEDGADGEPVSLHSTGTYEPLAGQGPRLQLATTALDDEAVALQVHGQPGDRIHLLFSRAAGWDPRPRGVFLLGSLLLAPLRSVGTIPAGGVLTLRMPLAAAPALGAYSQGVQAVSVAGGQQSLSEARWITVAD